MADVAWTASPGRCGHGVLLIEPCSTCDALMGVDEHMRQALGRLRQQADVRYYAETYDARQTLDAILAETERAGFPSGDHAQALFNVKAMHAELERLRRRVPFRIGDRHHGPNPRTEVRLVR